MPRRLRIEYEGAIYHVMTRGNARQDIVEDDDDRRRWRSLLEQTTACKQWEVVVYVLLNNHFHLLLKTPRPNLASGMQRFLSAYSQWWGRRRGRPGHLFQGRYKAESIEDETYYWTVSRYIHLNPVRAGLVARPEDWAWSSYPGYVDRRRRDPWIAHDALLASWQGGFGGVSPARGYRDFVEAGLKQPAASPFRDAIKGWILGSAGFADRLRDLAGPVTSNPPPPGARDLASLDAETVCRSVAEFYKLELDALGERRNPHIARAVAAGLCRQLTEATLRELAERLGLSRADSVPNLTRRFEAKMATSARLRKEVASIKQRLAPVGARPGAPRTSTGRPTSGSR